MNATYTGSKFRTYLYSNHHVKVSLAVLLNNISDVVRFPGLLKFPSGNKIFYLSDGPDGIAMSLSQSVDESLVVCETSIINT